MKGVIGMFERAAKTPLINARNSPMIQSMKKAMQGGKKRKPPTSPYDFKFERKFDK
jgi:hypothetical protein